MTNATVLPPGAVGDAVAAASPAFPATLPESLVAALGAMENIARAHTATVTHRTGGSHTITYANLGDTLTVIRPVLARYGLAVTQDVTNDGGRVVVTTTLLHWTGDTWTSNPLALPAGGDAQSVGSAITYARRYQLTAMLGLATEDDDGAAATRAAQPPRSTSRRIVKAGAGSSNTPDGDARSDEPAGEPPPADDESPAGRVAARFGIPKPRVLVDARAWAVANGTRAPSRYEQITEQVLDTLVEEYERRRLEMEANAGEGH